MLTDFLKTCYDFLQSLIERFGWPIVPGALIGGVIGFYGVSSNADFYPAWVLLPATLVGMVGGGLITSVIGDWLGVGKKKDE